MPVRSIDNPEEWEKLTGERGSIYIESPPAKRSKNCSHCNKTWDRR